MPQLEIRPFSDEHLEHAARLLAARHTRHRAAEPLLPARYEDPAAALEELEALRQKDWLSGAACFRGSRMVGYLVGIGRDPGIWGQNVWVDYAGQAFDEAEDAREAYAVAAAEWFAQGRNRHYVQVPASEPELVDAWFRLTFGQMQADGVGGGAGVPRDRHRLARHEPARLALLAAARLQNDLPPAVSPHSVTRVPMLAGSRLVVITADDDALVLRPPPPGDAVADVGAAV